MLYFSMLYFIISHYILLHYIILYSFLFYYIVFYYTILNCISSYFTLSYHIIVKYILLLVFLLYYYCNFIILPLYYILFYYTIFTYIYIQTVDHIAAFVYISTLYCLFIQFLSFNLGSPRFASQDSGLPEVGWEENIQPSGGIS